MVLRTIRGTEGLLVFADGGSHATSFTIRLSTDGGLTLDVPISEEEAWKAWATRDAPVPERFSGVAGGRRLTLEGEFQLLRSGAGSISFLCQGDAPFRWGDPQSSVGTLICPLTNCYFGGSEIVALPRGGWYLGALPLEFSGRVLRLEMRRTAFDRRSALRQSKGIAITSRAVTAVEGSDDLAAAVQAVDRVALLLSLAQGTLVSRIGWALKADDGNLISEEVDSPPMLPYKPRELIDTDDAASLKRFIEGAYTNYDSLDGVYHIRKVVHAKVDTAAAGFLETRALTASALIEYLARRYGTQPGLKRPIDRPTFRAARENLAARLSLLLSEVFGAALSEADRTEIVDRVQWFNEQTFARQLGSMVEGLDLPFQDSDLKHIRDTRNALVHRMEFSGTESPRMREEWTRMIHFVDLVLLRLLGYVGPYVDCRSWQRADLPPARAEADGKGSS